MTGATRRNKTCEKTHLQVQYLARKARKQVIFQQKRQNFLILSHAMGHHAPNFASEINTKL
jgi:hypothetical protein